MEEEQQDFVARAMSVVDFKSGDVIYKQGQNGDTFYIVDRGNVKCLKSGSCPSDEQLIRTCVPGDVFGEISILYNVPRAYTFRAGTDCRVYALERKVHLEYFHEI